MEMLKKIRQAIRSAAPKAEETISYMIPSFKYNGLLVGFGANKKGCSFYPMSGSILDEFAPEIKAYSRTKGALHLDFDKKLPVSLIKKITKARLKQNEKKAALKSKSK
ncbi:MAG: iron chaperone [Bacteroidia bacterium]